jgi:hypothetical protein
MHRLLMRTVRIPVFQRGRVIESVGLCDHVSLPSFEEPPSGASRRPELSAL